MKKIICLLVSIITCSLVLSGCSNNNVPDDARIKSFSFHRAGYPDWIEIDITLSDSGEYRFTSDSFYDGGLYPEAKDLYQKKGMVPEEQVVKLQSIIKEHNIRAWDGFDKSDDDVLDGASFSLRVEYDDGSTITAEGYMKWPDGFKEASEALMSHLQEIAVTLN